MLTALVFCVISKSMELNFHLRGFQIQIYVIFLLSKFTFLKIKKNTHIQAQKTTPLKYYLFFFIFKIVVKFTQHKISDLKTT